MGESVFAQIGHRAAGLLDHVVFGRCAEGHGLVGEVGHGQQELQLFVLALLQTVLQAFGLALDAGYLSLGTFGLLLLALLHQRADARSQFLQLRRIRVALMLKLAAFLVYLQYFRYNTATVKSFDSQSADHILRIGLYLLQCQHCFWVFESYP